ncbi:MAG: DUF362 domain-containing protein [Candidatus Omnitrophota bacterium]
MNSQLAILKCDSYSPSLISETIDKLFELLGGIERFVKRGEKVLIKPNLLSAALPEKGITTHPLIVKEIARRFKEKQAEVFIGDSPGGGVNIEEVYEKTGMKKIAGDLGIELVKFNRIRKIKNYPIAEIVLECDRFISLPKLKTHSLMIITGGIKNSFGLVPGVYKTELHLEFPRPKDFSRVLVDIFSIRPPDLVVIDGIVSMAGEGPTGGILRNTGVILGSSDAVAVDSVLAKLMGLNPFKISTIYEAYRRGLGEIEKIEVLGEDFKSLLFKDFPLPRSSFLNMIPQKVLKLGGNLLRTFPAIDNKICKRCKICFDNCPAKAIKIINGKLVIDYGLCIKCLCCYEFCPHRAIFLHKGFLLKLLDLVRK